MTCCRSRIPSRSPVRLDEGEGLLYAEVQRLRYVTSVARAVVLPKARLAATACEKVERRARIVGLAAVGKIS